MNFHEKTTTKKGKLGEDIAKRHLESKGLIVYQPVTDGAHPFDNLCATRDKKTIIIAEVKTKPHRMYYPDTGIDIRHYEDYMGIQIKYGIDVFLYFVDEIERKIYGNKLSNLIQAKQIQHKGKIILYPLKDKGIIYFPLSSMVLISNINNSQADEISQLSTRNTKYSYLSGGEYGR